MTECGVRRGALVVQPDWPSSENAKLLMLVAHTLGMTIYTTDGPRVNVDSVAVSKHGHTSEET